MSLLVARNISVSYDDRRALDGVDFSLARGELVGLIGPNGAGKTSLVRALAGNLDYTGDIAVDGVAFADLPRRERARRIAYLAQGAEATWPIPVARLVELGRLPYLGPFQKTTDADREAIDRALIQADVAHLAARRVTHLSGGERMRVLLARALAVDAKILLADEPIASLDPLHQLTLMESLRARAKDGAGVVVVLHDLTLAAGLCDRLVLLHEGKVLAEGAPADVLSEAHLARAYGIDALIEQRGARLLVVPWRVKGAAP
ncbi:MAG: ABC transporter ATP-binding protein [Alphaproteobacteria bacterium]